MGPSKKAWFQELARYAVLSEEAHVPTKLVGQKPETVRFGIADSTLSHLSENYTLITADRHLSGYLEDSGKQVLNFNHIRPLWMFS